MSDKFESTHTNKALRLIGRAFRPIPPSRRYPEGVPPRIILQVSRREDGTQPPVYKPIQTSRIAFGRRWIDASKKPVPHESYEYRDTDKAFQRAVRTSAASLFGWVDRAYEHVVEDCLKFLFPK